MEEKSIGEFKSRERWLSFFDQKNPDFSQFTNVPGLEDFVKNNKAQIDSLGKQDAITRKVLNQFLTPDHDNLVQGLDSINVDGET